MKRAKVMLTAIAVFAVVGGALAFKAKSQSNVFCINASNVCAKVAYTTQQISGAATTTNPCTAALQTVFYTEKDCITTFVEATNTVYQTAL